MTGNPRSAKVARGVVLFLALCLPVSARAQAIHHALTVVVQPESGRLTVEDVITPGGERPPHGVHRFLLNAGLKLTASTPDAPSRAVSSLQITRTGTLRRKSVNRPLAVKEAMKPASRNAGRIFGAIPPPRYTPPTAMQRRAKLPASAP